MIYGDADHIDEKDHVICAYPTTAYSFSRLMQDCFICQPAAFWRVRIANVVGPFNEKLHYAMDYDYWLRIDKAGGKIIYYPNKLACSRLYPTTKTLSSPSKMYEEILAVCREHGGYVSVNYMSGYLYHKFKSHHLKTLNLLAPVMLFIKSILLLYCALRYKEPRLVFRKGLNVFKRTVKRFNYRSNL
jgi:hypothetical protein